MNVDCDVDAFYQLYRELYGLVGRDARCFCSRKILPILLYAENSIAVGLDGVYEYRYRSLGSVSDRWCNGLGLSASASSKAYNLVGQAVADARCSALRQWMADSVLSGDFSRLSGMLAYFAREDKAVRCVFPNLRYRREAFMQLTRNNRSARQMLWADLAFNWRDKRGCSLADTIASQFRLFSSSMDERERATLDNVAEHLCTIRSERLDTYTVVERKDGHAFTLRHRDGRLFRDVMLAAPVADGAPLHHLAAQLVAYDGKTYASGPVVWLTDAGRSHWNGETLWSDIARKEQDAARQATFTTPFGKRISLYEDLYTVPEDPDEARYADMGIYLDEPNIFDFMEMLAPADAVDETVE